MYVADVLTGGIWLESMQVQDEELKGLAAFLPRVVLCGKALSTVTKYTGAFKRWKAWASNKHEVKVFPAKPFHVALYLSYLIQKSNTCSPVEGAVHALSWVHCVGTVEDPTQHPLVKQVLAGAKRILAQRTSKKEPITPEILEQLVRRFGASDAKLSDVRTITMCLVAFAAFLRFSELAGLKESDVLIFDDHMELYIESSKTDQYRDGAWVVVSRTDSGLCPVTMTEQYISLANIGKSQECHLFRGLLVTKNGECLRPSGSLSYSRVRELVLDKLSAIGLDKCKFGLHSLRSGGASAAANAGIPDRWFKRHGRWRSENAKDGYSKDSLHNRLQVTKSIGL